MSKPRLTPDDVRKIRTLVTGGVPASLVAAKFNLTTQYVQEVVRGDAWPSVAPAGPPERLDPEDAAVLIADESGHPYEWRDILTNRSIARRYLRRALRNTDPHSDLHRRLEQAGQALATQGDTR